MSEGAVSRADTTEGRTEALPSGRDPREVAGIYISDSLANIEAARRVLGRAAMLSPHLEIEFKTARSVLQEAQRINEELADDA